MLTIDVLEKHLGNSAAHVQSACAAARRRTENSNGKIASRIGQTVAFWKAGLPNEALLAAERLSKDFPSNGDVTCLLATALTRIRPPRWADADAKFAVAQRQKCSRREFIEGWIDAKVHIEDWTGLLNLAANTISTRGGEDHVLRAYIRAAEGLIKTARSRGDRARRIELSEAAIETLSRRTEGRRLSTSEREMIWGKKIYFAQTLMDDTRAACLRPGDYITVFDALSWLAERGIFGADFVKTGVAALHVWWSDVENRPYLDEGAKALMQKSLARLEQIERILNRNGNQALCLEVRRLRIALENKLDGLGWSI